MDKIELSKTWAANLAGMVGQGLIVNTTRDLSPVHIPCSLGCEKNAMASGQNYTQVFAVVEHPEHGHIAVTKEEFEALGLPEKTYVIDKDQVPHFYPEGAKEVSVPLYMTPDKAMALAQLAKRIGFTAVMLSAVDETEAYLMMDALAVLAKGLAEAGYSPR